MLVELPWTVVTRDRQSEIPHRLDSVRVSSYLCGLEILFYVVTPILGSIQRMERLNPLLLELGVNL